MPILKAGGAPINVLRFIRGSNGMYSNILISKSHCNNLVDNANKVCERYYDLDVSKIDLNSLKLLYEIIKKERPNIIHTNGKCGLFYGLLMKCFFSDIKFVHTYRGFYLPSGFKKSFHRLVESIYSNVVDECICVSKSELEKVKQNLFFNPNLQVIPNGVDIVKCELSEVIKGNVNRYDLNITSLSRVCEQKNIVCMLQAFELCYKDGMALHIFGGGMSSDHAYKNIVINELSKLNCRKHVYLYDDVFNASGMLNNFDLYLSTALFEGLPTGVIEAGLSKLPVVATPCVGNIDLINDDTGYLSSSFKPVDISVSLMKCIDELSSKVQEGKINHLYSQCDGFSVKNNILKFDEVYNR